MPSNLPTPPLFPPLFPSLILLTLIISTSPQTTSLPEYDDFISDCGSTNPPVKPANCFITPNCCFANGTIQLTTQNICIKVEDPNNQQLRINTIEALSHLATNINLECANVTKSIPSNCGEPNPKNVKDCIKSNKKGNDCCFIKVVDEQGQTYTGCMQFQNLDINTIGEAVRAAETRNAKLNIDCYGMYMKYNVINLMLFMLILFYY